MELMNRVYLGFSKFFPKPYRMGMRQSFIYAGDKGNPDFYLGSSALLSLVCFIMIILIPYGSFTKFQLRYFVIGIAAVALIQLTYYFIVLFRVSDRTERIEKVLPDALQLISSNLKAGMTPYQALKMSARKEFGPLSEEINTATALSMGTQSFSEALGNISKNVKSEILDRSIKLFTTAMKSGGHLATLLQELSKEISKTRALKRELVTNTKTYAMFIMFTVIIGSPLLMVVSIHFLAIVSSLQASTGTSSSGFGLDFLAGDIAITPGFLTIVAYFMLAITSVLSCMLLGVIKEGKLNYGIRYAPVVLLGSFTVFFVVRYFIGGAFG